jgi:hypothetical protein
VCGRCVVRGAPNSICIMKKTGTERSVMKRAINAVCSLSHYV